MVVLSVVLVAPMKLGINVDVWQLLDTFGTSRHRVVFDLLLALLPIFLLLLNNVHQIQCQGVVVFPGVLLVDLGSWEDCRAVHLMC